MANPTYDRMPCSITDGLQFDDWEEGLDLPLAEEEFGEFEYFTQPPIEGKIPGTGEQKCS